MPILWRLLFILFTSCSLFAEKSGVFIGVGVGGAISTGSYVKKQASTPDILFPSLVDTSVAKGDGVNLEFIFGYKQFFLENLGLRYYVNVDYATGMRIKNSLIDNPRSVYAINSGVNLDLLFNFLVLESFDMGLYAGMQVGVNTLGGDFNQDMRREYNKTLNPLSNNQSSAYNATPYKDVHFSTSVNFGFRMNFLTNSGIELFAKVPLLTNELLGIEFIGAPTTDKEQVFFKQPYVVGIRYVYSF